MPAFTGLDNPWRPYLMLFAVFLSTNCLFVDCLLLLVAFCLLWYFVVFACLLCVVLCYIGGLGVLFFMFGLLWCFLSFSNDFVSFQAANEVMFF